MSPLRSVSRSVRRMVAVALVAICLGSMSTPGQTNFYLNGVSFNTASNQLTVSFPAVIGVPYQLYETYGLAPTVGLQAVIAASTTLLSSAQGELQADASTNPVAFYAVDALDPQTGVDPNFDPETLPEGEEKEQLRRAYADNLPRISPAGYIPRDWYEQAFRLGEAQALHLGPFRAGMSLRDWWVNIGPSPLCRRTADVATDGDNGRVTDIAVDPGNVNHWIIGSAHGGVWETTDGGSTWQPLTDNQPALAIGCVAFAPSRTTTMYAGTGEGVFGGDAYGGAGLLKSEDGGVHWTMLGNSWFKGSSISAIKIDPENPDRLTVSSLENTASYSPHQHLYPPPVGVFVSTNGGVTWKQKIQGQGTDIEIHPSNYGCQYAGVGDKLSNAVNGVYRSLDGGETWAVINGPWTHTNCVGRVELAVSTMNPDVLYASIQNGTDQSSVLGVWRTDNAWAPNPDWRELPWDVESGYCVPCAYNHQLTVDPRNPDVIYGGGFGVSMCNSSNWTETEVIHCDQHAFAWAGDRLLVGNDGGIWSTTNILGDWVSHNGGGLSIFMFMRGAIHQTSGNFALGGAYDNGTVVWRGSNQWEGVYDGDGMSCGIYAPEPETHWAMSYQSGHIARTTDGDVTGNQTYPVCDIMPRASYWNTVFELCPDNTDVMLAGANQLYRMDNFFTGDGYYGGGPVQPDDCYWHTNSPFVSIYQDITAIAFAPAGFAAPAQTYVYGTDFGRVWGTENAGGTWRNLDPNTNLPHRMVTGLDYCPTNRNVLYASLSGFNENTGSRTGHVYMTTNAFSPTPIWRCAGIPADVPANCIRFDVAAPDTIYLGTDVGLWRTTDGGSNWCHMGVECGFPNVPVYDIRCNAQACIAFTHGRGAFKLVHAGRFVPLYRWIFNDDFGTDGMGQPPAAEPDGGPINDRVELPGAAGAVTVISSPILNSPAAKLQCPAVSGSAVLDCVVSDGPYSSGKFVISYAAYSAQMTAAPVLTVSPQSDIGGTALNLVLSNGTFTLISGDGVETLAATYLPNKGHEVQITLDFTTGLADININGEDVATGKPFLATFNNLSRLRFSYPPPFMENAPGIYVVDDITIGQETTY